MNFWGLQPLGGAITIKYLYLIIPCTDSHQISYISQQYWSEFMIWNWWTLATGDALGGAINVNILFHTLPVVSAFPNFKCFFSIAQSTHVMVFMIGRGFMPLWRPLENFKRLAPPYRLSEKNEIQYTCTSWQDAQKSLLEPWPKSNRKSAILNQSTDSSLFAPNVFERTSLWDFIALTSI